ncbi:GerAB/ArcD/ProY family transporter [Brevibacillus panacihumi]|uniref:GerAB/ArcD/ProY family transporter n=1 Tax=Brevibacillus panacihumi TaxID=497735 RepID=UPI003CFFACAD
MIKDKLTNTQMALQMFAAMVGVGVLSLPSVLVGSAGVDAWLVILLAGGYAVIAVSIMAYLGNRFPGKSIIQYAPLLLGHVLGTCVLLAFLLYFLMFVGTIVRMSADVTKLFLLDLTPVEVIVLGMLVTSTYLILQGVNAIARFNEFIQPLALFALLLVLTQTLRETDFGRLLPVLGDGIQSVLQSFPSVFFSLLGFEILLFLHPFMENPSRGLQSAFLAIGMTVVLYALLTILSIALMGAAEVELIEYPALAIIKSIEVPGSFIERLDSIMMMVWVPFAVTSIVMFHYCASLITSQLLGLQDHRVVSLLYVPIVFLIAVLPRNVLEVERWSQWTSWLGAGLVSLVPLSMIVAYKWRARRVSST